MMTGVVIALLLLGVLLLVIEILFVPGTTIVGIGGVVLVVLGIYVAYSEIGSVAGHFAVGASLLSLFVVLTLMFKGRTWQRLALNKRLTETSGPKSNEMVSIGESGVTMGRLNPSGKATFGDLICEVHTTGDFIDNDTKVQIVKIIDNRIQVERI